jgi:hypothetical protein
VAGPARTIEPVWGVATVATLYAAGPSNPAARATPSTAGTALAGSRSASRKPAAAARPSARTTTRSQPFHEVTRESRTKLQTPVITVTAANGTEPTPPVAALPRLGAAHRHKGRDRWS